MAVKNFKKYQELAKLCDNTFGKAGLVRSNTQSVSLRMVDDELLNAKYMCVVNFGSENQMNQMKIRYKNEGVSLIEANLKKLKELYEEKMGEKLTLTMDTSTIQDSLEYISYQYLNPKKTCYYRVSCYIKVE